MSRDEYYVIDQHNSNQQLDQGKWVETRIFCWAIIYSPSIDVQNNNFARVNRYPAPAWR